LPGIDELCRRLRKYLTLLFTILASPGKRAADAATADDSVHRVTLLCYNGSATPTTNERLIN